MLTLKIFPFAVRPTYLCRKISSWQITFDRHGEPLDVLYDKVVDIPSLKNDHVIVNYRASTINPSDINAIQGIYPIKPSFPAVPGNEGAGRVIECGSGVSKLKPGDLVIPAKAAMGTWRNVAMYCESDLFRLNPKLDVVQAAALNINPSTAYLMLTRYVDLKPGDCVIQNGATSAAGIYVMQMCKLMNINSINLFRARDTPEKTEATRQALLDYGGTLVLTEEELKQRNDIRELGDIKLGLDCLGGQPGYTIMKNLANYGTFVNYGAMTRQPLSVPASFMIFKGIQIRGFWLSGRQHGPNDTEMRLAMLNKFSEWMIDGKLKLSPITLFPYGDWKAAISQSLFSDGKPKNLPSKALLSFPELS